MTLLRTFFTAALVLAANALPDRYFCATFSAATAGGAQGYMAVRVRDSDATYGLSMDWSGFSSCVPTSTSINYHLHTMWMDGTSNVGVGATACGAANLGGHYDPTLQCASASQFASTLCTSLSRPGSQYNCSSSLAAQGYWSSCEVGDLSGKAGSLTTLRSNVVYTDVRPPSVVDYGATNGWTSVVFHCPTARVLCGRLVEVASWRACTGMDFPSSGATATAAWVGLGTIVALASLLL